MPLIAKYDFENSLSSSANQTEYLTYLTNIGANLISIPSYATSVDVLIVGGGGGGGGGYQGGGGGGGGVVFNSAVSTLANKTLYAIVGDGGTGVASGSIYPTNGFDSALCYPLEYSINSDFTTDVNGWTSQSSASNSWNSTNGRTTPGCAVITSTGSSNCYNSFGPNPNLTIGKKYILSSWVKSSSNTTAVFGIGTSIHTRDILSNQTLGVTTTYKQISYIFTATATSVYFVIWTPNTTLYVDNVSIMEVIYGANGGGLGACEIQAMSMSPNYDGAAGASGGGGSHGALSTLVGGAGISGQGYAGGTGWSALNQYMGAGGGGAGGPGVNATATSAGAGGPGLFYFGAWYGVGGGGSSRGDTAGPSALSGLSTLGGGQARGTGFSLAENGIANTGQGGGAGGSAAGATGNGGNGGSGVVVLRWIQTSDDSKVTSNNLSVINSGSTFVDGKINQYAIHMSGTQYATVPISQFGTMSEVTVSCWVKLDSTTVGLQQLINAVVDDSFNRFNIHFTWSGTMYWDWGNPNGTGRVSVANPLDTNWNLWTFTAGQAGMFIYKNGEVIASNTANYHQFTATGKSLTIGNTNDGTHPLNGAIDDFRIYSHQLSARDIYWLYHGQLSTRQSIEMDKGLITRWDFNEQQEASTYLDGPTLSVYNNYGMTASITLTGGYYKGSAIQRLSMTPSTQGQVDNFNSAFGNHGVFQNSISWTANVITCSSIYWKPVSHVGNTFVEGSPSNQGGWYGHYTEDQGDGWFRSVSLHNIGTTQSDQKFWGAKTSGMTLGQTFICDFAGAQVEQKDHPSQIILASRAGLIMDVCGRNHITAQPGTTPQWVSSSKRGTGAYYFNGASRLDAGTFFQYHTFTIAMWVKPDSTQPQYADIFDNNHSGSNQNFVLQQNSTTTNQYSFNVMGLNPSPLVTSGNFNLTASVWSHIAFCLGNDSLNTYINGTLFSSVPRRGNINYVSQNFTLGSHYSIAGRNWKGYMDDVRIWNRALNSSEVQELYSPTASLQIDDKGNIWSDSVQHSSSTTFSIDGQKGTLTLPLYGPTSQLVGYWPLMKDANDYSGNNNHGLMSGTSLTPRVIGINGNRTFDFPGVADNYVNVASVSTPTNTWSLGGWLMKTVHNPATYPIFLSFSLPYISCDSSSASFRLSYWNGAQQSISGTTIPTLNTWYHVFATGNGNSVKLYINGNLEASASNMNSLGGSTTPPVALDIGRHLRDNAYIVAGRICEVRYYSRELSNYEIFQLYSFQTPTTTAKLGQNIAYNKIIGR